MPNSNHGSKHTKPHILLVDDRLDEARSLLTLLQAQHWRVSLESDPERGYLKAVALKPSLILLDVYMPRMNGFALCRLLRESPSTRTTPIIFLTSATQVEHRLEGLTLGGVDYVLKPYDPHELLARIRIHLQLAWRESPKAEPSGPLPAPDKERSLLQATMRFIDENLDSLPTLNEIALKVGTHEKQLSKVFRRHLDMTVFAYVSRIRLKKGKELLANSELSINDISELVGFQNACNFTTAFRKAHGMTPREFRRQAQSTGSDQCG